MIAALLLLALGLSLSAFFSGIETGFYRVTRSRLVIEALSGDWLSKLLLWTANNPSLFVATALVGNNVANYLCSAAVVLGAGALLPGSGAAELIGPMLLAPVIFVFGELLPKSLFYRAPNRLLRRCAPPLLVAGIVFAPATALLWLLSRLVELVGRKSPPEIRMVLARRELGQLLEEGHAVGLLQPTQQAMAQSALSLGNQPVRTFMSPARRYPSVLESMSPSEALALASRHRRTLLPVENTESPRQLVGYVNMSRCLLSPDGTLPIEPLLTVGESDSYLATLSRMIANDHALARVTGPNGQTTGYITLRGLQQAMLAEQSLPTVATI